LGFIGEDGAAAGGVLFGDVYGEGGAGAAVGCGIENFEGAEGLTFHRIGFQAGDESCFETEIGSGVVIGMAAFPVGKDDRVRLEFAEDFGDGNFLFVGDGETGVGEAEVAADFHAENFRGDCGFAEASFRSATRAGFTAGKVENASAISCLRHFENSAAAGEFDVVGMGGDGEQVEWHEASEVARADLF